MANEVSTKALVNELEKAVDSAQNLLKVFNKTEDVTKDIAKQLEKAFGEVDSNTSKGLAAFNKLIQETNKLTEDSEKLQQDKIKTETLLIKKEKELSNARIQEIKELDQKNKLYLQETKTRIAVKKEQERQLKLFKQETKQLGKNLDAYQKQSKRLNELRKRYKALAAEEKENTKEAKTLLKEITKLDKKLKEIDETVGQNQRSVGKYKDAVKGLNSTIGKLGIAAVIAKGVELLGSAFGDSREGALEAQIAFSKFTETAKVVIANIVKSFGGIKDLFGAIGDSFALAGAKIERTFLQIQKVTPFAADVTQALIDIEQKIKKLSESSVSDAIDKIALAFADTTTTVTEAIKAQEIYLRLQLKTTIAISKQEKELAGLQERRQILQDISDDDTIGFVTRAKAVKRAGEIAIEFANKEVALAKTKEKLAFEAVKQDLRRNQIDVSRIKTSQDLITLLEKDSIAKKVSDANDEAFSAAYVERREKEVESQSFKRDQEEKFRKTARDAFEQELDILEEFTEKKIASNALIIADDKATLEERTAAQAENEKLEKELFENSIDLIVKQGKASIDLRKDLTAAEKEQQKALLDGIDLQKIINTEDASELFILLRKLDLGEIEEKRTKDSIKIKKDLLEVNKESNKVQDEAILKTKELQEEIALQERKLAGEKIDLEDEQKEAEKKRLQERIDLLKEDSVARLELEKELNELLLEENKTAAEQQAELKEQILETAEQVLEDLLNKRSEKRIDRIEKEQEANQTRIDQITEAIENGNEEAKQSLAEEEKRSAELAAQKEKERKNAIKLEAGLAILKAFGENDGNLGKTIADSTALIAFISSIGSFFEGTEDTGTVNKPLDSNGGRVAILHDNERVLTAKQNAKLGGLSNDDVADLGAMHSKGVENGGVTVQQYNNQEMISGIREITNAVKNIPVSSYNYDANGKYHVQVLKNNNGTQKLRMKARNPYTSA